MSEWQVYIYNSFTLIMDASFKKVFGAQVKWCYTGSLELSILFLSLVGLRIFEELVEVEYLVCTSSHLDTVGQWVKLLLFLIVTIRVP